MNQLLEEKGITKYRLSKESGIPYTTISDICTGKTNLEKCSGETLYHISKVLKMTIEELIEPGILADDHNARSEFEIYKSNICHRVKDIGDIKFIIETLQEDQIRKLYKREWYRECFYLLAMVDYLSRENELPICLDYEEIRQKKLQKPIYPASVIVAATAEKNERLKRLCEENAIPEFKRFNIIEGDIRDVC